MPRPIKILRIYKLDFPHIGCQFNTGEKRIIDLKELFDVIGLKEGQFGHEVIEDIDLFNTVELKDFVLTWDKVRTQHKLKSGKTMELNFQLDNEVVHRNAKSEDSSVNRSIGHFVRKYRKQLRLTQSDVAANIGTTKHSISRIEQDRISPEAKTLINIFEVGFDKRYFISIYDPDSPFETYSNCLLNQRFYSWLNRYGHDIALIDNLSDSAARVLKKYGLADLDKLAAASSIDIYNIIAESKLDDELGSCVTWPYQARLMSTNNWVALIGFQRSVHRPHKEAISKIELIASSKLGEELFEIPL